MDIDIFVSTFGVKIGDKLYSHSLLEKDDTGEKFYKFLEDNIPKTCKFVKLYCQRETLLETIIDIISYMHRYNIVLSIYISIICLISNIMRIGINLIAIFNIVTVYCFKIL